MAVPDFQSFMLPLLKLAGDGQPHTLTKAVEQLAQEFQPSDETGPSSSKAGKRACTTESAGHRPTSRRRACSRLLGQGLSK